MPIAGSERSGIPDRAPVRWRPIHEIVHEFRRPAEMRV
jgi:hypothetical protein